MENIQREKDLCTLYLVRHGETEWNVKGITQGQTNSSLTDNGKQQALNTANELKGVLFDAVFSSDLTRAKDTAEIIKLNRDIITQTSELLRERSFGSFEGKHGNEFRRTLKDKILEREKLSEEDGWSFKLTEDVETDEELVVRFLVQLREIAISYPNKTVLVVSHGGPIRMFLSKIGYKAKKELTGGTFKNGGYVKVISDGINFLVQDINGVVQVKNH